MAFLGNVRRKKVPRADVSRPSQEEREVAKDEHEALVREMETRLNPLCRECRHLNRGKGFDPDTYLACGGGPSLYHMCSLGGDAYSEGSECVMREAPVGCRDCDHCHGTVGTMLGGTVIVACDHSHVGVNGGLIPIRERCEYGRDRKVSDAVVKAMKENIMRRAGMP